MAVITGSFVLASNVISYRLRRKAVSHRCCMIKTSGSLCSISWRRILTHYAGHVKEHVPDWWGIITVEEVDGEADFYVLRKPDVNPRVKAERNVIITR